MDRMKTTAFTAFVIFGILAGAWGPILPNTPQMVGTAEAAHTKYPCSPESFQTTGSDGFEDGDAIEWNGDVTVTDAVSYSGTYSGELRTGTNYVTGFRVGSEMNGSRGDTFIFHIWQNSTTTQNYYFFVQKEVATGSESGYRLYTRVDIDGGKVGIRRVDNGSATIIAENTSTNLAGGGQWLTVMGRTYSGNNTIQMKVWNESGVVMGTVSATDATYSSGGVGLGLFDENLQADDILVGSCSPGQTVTGTVTDQDGAAVANATVNVTEDGSKVVSVNTSVAGEYSAALPNGSYTVTVNKTGYHSKSKNITVAGDDETLDFTLVEKETGLQLEFQPLVEHGESIPYKVFFVERNADGTLVETDVTDVANVSSNNTSVATVDSVNFELVGTNDESINAAVEIQSNYTVNGTQYWDNETLVVANVSIKNIVILPGPYRITASFSPDSTGATDPMLAILVATLVGIVGARASSAFGGLAAMVMALIVAWFGGFVSTGIMLVAVFAGTFIGLNVAGNVRYTRGGG